MSVNRFTLRSAVYLILIKEDKIFLLRRFNTGWQDGKYTPVAGHLDGDETVKEAMIREAREEAGIILEEENLQVIHTMHRKSNNNLEYIDFFLIAKEWKGELKIGEPEKSDDMGWFPIDKLPENTLPYIKQAIEGYFNKTTFSEFDWE